jgi:serine/threonine protein kinase
MDPDPRDRVKRLVEEARAQPAASRAAFLDAACGDDEALRRSVERGLDDTLREGSANGSEGLVTATSGMGLDFEDAAGPPEVELPEGARVGPYRVVSRLGRGGQGAVYLAERADQQYEKRVAVKIVPHGLGSELSHRLFRHERQILAGLDHPNIARLLDAGTTEQGFPYFVLEYVEGEPLDRYCDRRGLTTIERLRLFRTVCEAVQYAHRNLVVHRDLKPRNILVSAEGVPKLLDFGIAKLLQPGAPAARTVTAGGVMTPDYASPEQIRFEPITTASDVYSLGVILYELLARRRPYRVKTLALLDLARAICEEEPPRPSVAAAQPSERGWSSPEEQQAARRLARELRGDLDTIVMTALQKDPPRRFPSVEALSEDLRRYLEGLPVRARPEGSLYRAGKFVRRHKGGVAAAALVFLSLLAGLVATAWQARIADEQRRRAERRFADVRGLANSLLFEIHDAIEDLAGGDARPRAARQARPRLSRRPVP